MVDLYRDPSGRTADTSYPVRQTRHPAGLLMAGGEIVWSEAHTITWGPKPYETRFRAVWDEGGLWVRFDADDDRPWHTHRRRDSALWDEEVCELFLDPCGTGRDYAEVEISPANVLCDLRIAEPWPSLRGEIAWDWAGMETRVLARPAAEGIAEGSWTAILSLPWSGLRSLSDAAAGRVPPRAGDRWRFNVFRIKRPGGPDRPEEGAVYAAWSAPGGPSFHVPAVFRELVFE